MDARRWGAQGERPGATGRASCSTKDGMGSHQQRLTQRSEFKVEQSRGITSFPTAFISRPLPSTCKPSPKPKPRSTPTPRPRPPSSPTPPPPPSPQTSPPPPAGPPLVRYLRPRCPHQFIGFPRVIWGLVDSLPPPSPRQHAHLPFACPCRVGLGLQRRRTRADDVEGVDVQGGQDA